MYSVDGNGETNYVVANDEKTDKELWRAKVYHVRINPFVEADVQLIYIKGMALSGEKLLLQDEAGRCYRLSLDKHKVAKDSCQEYLSLTSAK